MKKKTYITTEAGRFALYTGITAVYGGWILETGGTPACLNGLEDAHCEDKFAQVAAIIADPRTPWEALTDEDEAYIADTLRAWGCGGNPPRITPEEVAHALQDSVSIEFTDDGDIEYYAYVGVTEDGRAAMRSDHGEPVSDIECFTTLVSRDDYREEILADVARAHARLDFEAFGRACRSISAQIAAHFGCTPPTLEAVADVLGAADPDITDGESLEYSVYAECVDGKLSMQSSDFETATACFDFTVPARRFRESLDDYKLGCRFDILAPSEVSDFAYEGLAGDDDDDDTLADLDADEYDPITLDGPLGIYEHETMTCGYFSAAVDDLTEQINAYLRREYENG